jgi:hypothetical protein
MKRLFHGIERLACARENSILEKRCERAVERTFVPLAPGAVPGAQGHNGHAVLREGAGLVGAEHRGGAECFNRRDTPGQDTGARDAPRAHHHEDGEDERKFFRQHRHAERDAAQQRIEPAAAPETVQNNRERAEAEADGGEVADQAPCLCAQPRRFGIDARNRKADFADLAARAGRGDFGAAMPPDDQTAGIDIRQIIAAGPCRRGAGRRNFAHGDGLVRSSVGTLSCGTCLPLPLPSDVLDEPRCAI